MPKLARLEDRVGVERPRTGGPYARFDASPVGRGMERLGRGISALGASLKGSWGGAKRSSAASKYLRHRHAERRKANEFADAVPADEAAEGAAEIYMEGLQERDDAFLESLPEGVRAEYGERLNRDAEDAYIRVGAAERAAVEGFHIRTADAAVSDALIPRVIEAASFGVGDSRGKKILNSALEDAGSIYEGFPATDVQAVYAKIMDAYELALQEEGEADMDTDDSLNSPSEPELPSLTPHQVAARQYVSQINKPNATDDETTLLLHEQTLDAFDIFLDENPDASPTKIQEFATGLIDSESEAVREHRVATLPLPSALDGTPRSAITKEALEVARVALAASLTSGAVTPEDAAKEALTLRSWITALSGGD